MVCPGRLRQRRTYPMTDASIAHWTPCTEAEGPGKRFALWFQGCPMRCPGCCNPEMLPFEGGEKIPISRIVTDILAARRDYGIEGITLLGGEPLAHAPAAAAITKSESRASRIGAAIRGSSSRPRATASGL